MVQRKVLIILSLDIVVFIRRDCNYSRVCEKREKERERERMIKTTSRTNKNSFKIIIEGM
jgi:hypothetical protein